MRSAAGAPGFRSAAGGPRTARRRARRDEKPTSMTEHGKAERYAANLQGEIDGAALYRALAETERDPKLAEVYRRLSQVEDAHAQFWRKRLTAIGQAQPRLKPGFRSRALAWLARRFGPDFVLPAIHTLEQVDSGQYDAQP